MYKAILTALISGISFANANLNTFSNGNPKDRGHVETESFASAFVPRSQSITCGLQFPGVTQLEASQTVVVQNGEARIIGQSRNYKFGFSVAGKTGLGKISDLDTGFSVVAKGAIEMLSHGGRESNLPMSLLRRGEDDGNGHHGSNPAGSEREGGFDLALNNEAGNLVTLKCESQKFINAISLPTQKAQLKVELRNQGIPVLSHCSEQDYVDMSGDTAHFMIATKGASYTPRCLRVRKGTSLRIQASASHPLQGIESMAGAPVNPIFDEFGATSNVKSYMFSNSGVFGYYCVAHGNDRGEGMAGAIWVVE